MTIMAVEVVEHNGTRYAEIIWGDTQVEKTTFFSPPESSFQFGLLAHEAGYQEPPHYHQPFVREINDLQQMFVVQRGPERAYRFTSQDFVKGVFEILDRFEPIRRIWSSKEPYHPNEILIYDFTCLFCSEQ